MAKENVFELSKKETLLIAEALVKEEISYFKKGNFTQPQKVFEINCILNPILEKYKIEKTSSLEKKLKDIQKIMYK